MSQGRFIVRTHGPQGPPGATGAQGPAGADALAGGAQPARSLLGFVPPAAVVTTFQTGHGWITNGTGVGSSSLNDTTDFVLGSQAARVTSTGLGGACQLRKLAGSAVSAVGRSIRLWIKVDDVTHVSSIVVYAGDTTLANRWTWTIDASGSQSGHWLKSGEWVSLTLNWQDATQTGAPTRSAITDWQVALTDDAAGAVTMRLNGITLVPEPSSTYPTGVVTFTFDDGWDSQYSEARKKLDQYAYPAVAYLIADMIGQSGRLTLAQARALQDANGWQVSGHAATDTVHGLTFTGVDSATAKADYIAMREWLLANGFAGGDHLAWPLGAYDPTVLREARRYWASARSIHDRTHETVPPADPLRLRCRTVTNADSTATIQGLIDKAYADRGWLILCFHKIVASPAQSTEYSIANFGTIVDYVATKGIPVRTVDQVLRGPQT